MQMTAGGLFAARNEIYRYLGYPQKAEPDARMQQMMDELCRQLEQTAQVRTIIKQTARSEVEPFLAGKDLARHLEGCCGCLLIAVTLGAQADQLLRKLSVQDMSRAVMLDAAASVYVEKAAQAAEESERERLQAQGLYLTGRFSPGYGDFPLSAQADLLAHLDAARRIGLTATSDSILVPRKSITAICGVADHPVKGKLAGCGACALNATCKYRKEGKRCADECSVSRE